MQQKEEESSLETTIFMSGNSKAVRIPAAIKSMNSGDAVTVTEQADGSVVIIPKKKKLTGLYELFQAFGSDFMKDGREEVEDRNIKL